LPPKFGVSPTFNIADLKPYLGEEDELAPRTTSFQEGEDDEDITPLDTNNSHHMDMQGPITRARALRLNQEVSLFLCTFSNYKNDMLPNELLCLGIMERINKYLEEDLDEEKIRRGVQVKSEAHNIPSSSLPWSPGAAWTKTDAQVAYGVKI
jgi:hypothetical protein